MTKVTGIGGLFFRSRDTEALSAWYEKHLGIPGFWQQQAGMTVFSPFKQETDYFAADKQWMLNLRVESIDDAIRDLRAAGIAVETRPGEWDTPETGRFARIHDPEGNAIELWEPPAGLPAFSLEGSARSSCPNRCPVRSQRDNGAEPSYLRGMRAVSRWMSVSFVCVVAAACGGKKPSEGVVATRASAASTVAVPTSASVGVSIPTPSASAAVSSSPRVVPLGSAPGPLEIVRSAAAGLTLVLAEDAAHATIVNEKTGEWRFVKPRREGETLVLEAAGGTLSVSGPSTKRRLSLRLGEGAVRAFDATIVKPLSSAPTAVFTAEGEPLSPEALSAAPKLLLGKTALIWRDGFLPASPSLPTPSKLALGARAIVAAPIATRREGACTIVGLAPTAEGALGGALKTAQDGLLTKLCRDRRGATLVEASYAFVRFKGVNLDEGWAPDPTDAVGLDLLFRVTDQHGSSVVEVGYVVGLAKAEIASLVSLLKPTGAAFLQKKALEPYVSSPPQLGSLDKTARMAALDLAQATLTVGPSTIDIVLPTEPWGLFLGDHRVRLGPRSDTFPAFVSGTLTARLVAPLLVDY